MLPSICLALLLSSALAFAQTYDPRLVGTWSSKSNKTLTGPGFYDPINDKLIEPSRTGISYSFTADGFYEEAYFRAVANPQNPACPKGIMQWQHGTYLVYPNGSLILTPIAVDGREMISDPCNYDSSIYMRYNQSELFQRFEVLTDPYHNIPRLNLYKFDGSPMIPMYLVYSPPEMLPTSTLHPQATPTGKSTGSGKLKRAIFGEDYNAPQKERMIKRTQEVLDPTRWWWFGLILTGFGGFLYLCF